MNYVKFEAGNTYQTRSACDHNCIVKIEVTSRTEKSIKVKVDNSVKTLRVFMIGDSNDQIEAVRPWGRYSMSPIVAATDTHVLLRDWEKPMNQLSHVHA